MTVGLLIFTGLAVFLNASASKPLNPEVAKILPVVIACVAVSELPVYVLLRKQLLARVTAERSASAELVEQGRIPLPLQTLAIVGAALAEGVGLLGGVTLLLGGSLYVLAAPALAALLIVVQVPTRAKLEQLVRG